MDVVLVVKVTKMELIDSHKLDLSSPLRDVIFITYSNGVTERLDLFSEMDTTNIDYWDYKKTKKSKEIIIFKQYDINKIANEIE